MERLRCCEPVPHDLLHTVQALKAEVAQWTGHGPSVHACVSAVCAHALPPLSGAVLVRVRDWKPAPHDVEHEDQTAGNWPSTQSIGHACALHVRASRACGHALPPNVGSVVARLRFCEPVPHDLVHVDQAPNAGTMQSPLHA